MAAEEGAPLGPGDLVGRRFQGSLNGYERREVDDILDQAARGWERTRQELSHALARLAEIEAAPPAPRGPYEGLGGEVEEMLTAARRVADGVIASAEETRLRLEAEHGDLERIREEGLEAAREEAAAILAAAEAERGEILASAAALRASIAALVRGVDPLLAELPAARVESVGDVLPEPLDAVSSDGGGGDSPYAGDSPHAGEDASSAAGEGAEATLAGEPAAGEPAAGEPAAGEPAAGEPVSEGALSLPPVDPPASARTGGEPAAGTPAEELPTNADPATLAQWWGGRRPES